MPSPMVTQNTHADRETVIYPAMGEAARERGEGEGGVTGGGKKMKCRECERDLPLSAFYPKPGGGVMSPDCRLCYGDKQRIRKAKVVPIVDERDECTPMDEFLRRKCA